MKFCDKCKVQVIGPQEECPLCQRTLRILDTEEKEQIPEVFPYIPTLHKAYHMIFKIMNFISIALVVVSVALNLILSDHNWWSVFVIAAVACFWLSFFVAFRKRQNIPKNILYQVVTISCIVALWDYITGWKGWSVDFVIPILCLSDLLVLYILSKILHSDVEDYMIYMLIGGVFGVIPIIFYACGWLNYILPSIVCVASSILFFAAVVIFQGEKIKEELRRRLHY